MSKLCCNWMLFLKEQESDWFVRETIGFLRRIFSRLDVSSRSIFAIIEPGSCFAGTLARAGARRRPQLHARRGERPADRALRAELRRLSDGERTLAGCRRISAAKLPRLKSRRFFQRKTRGSSAWSPPLRTTSTGRTRCASPSRSAPACRPMRSPAWKRACASPARRPC